MTSNFALYQISANFISIFNSLAQINMILLS